MKTQKIRDALGALQILALAGADEKMEKLADQACNRLVVIEKENGELREALIQLIKMAQEYADLPDESGRVAAPDSLVRRRIREARELLDGKGEHHG